MKRRSAVFVLSFFLAGCGGGASAPEQRTYDLGMVAPGAGLPAVRISSVRAAAPFDTPDMQYRLAYRNAAEISVFAASRWAATPAELFRKQLLRATSDKPGKCGLDIEIQEFTQIFTAKDASEARIDLRAWLGAGASRSSTRGWSTVEANAGADAASGAAAFARAVDRAIAELGAWIAEQPDCR